MKDIHVRELAAWGFDRYRCRHAVDRAKVSAAKALVSQRPHFQTSSPICDELTKQHAATLASYASRPDLLDEVGGLTWSLAIVDLIRLLAFQRRLSFDKNAAPVTVPNPNDWPALFELCFARPKVPGYTLERQPHALAIRTTDPNLHVRLAPGVVTPLVLHAGSPFLEVARHRDRWFLRDGYHRAYALMRANIVAVPAVIVEVQTMAELGADQTRFFPEAILMSLTPPTVADFLDDDLTVDYERPTLTKTIHIRIKESFAPVSRGRSPR